MRPSLNIESQIRDLQQRCRACTRCVADGIIPEARPVVEGSPDAEFLLVGQAPGLVEFETRHPFSGRAGRILAGWMETAGFTSEAEFRHRTYIAAVMRCFPGRSPAGGDLRPPTRALANCRSWLDAELAMLTPRVVIPVGQLAIERFLGPGTLEARVGRTFRGDPLIIPLPHPSGQSRWLNSQPNRQRLRRALALLSEQLHELR